MNTKKKWILTIVILIIVIFAFIVWALNRQVEPEVVVEENEQEQIAEEEDADPYREEVAENMVAIEKDDVVEDERIAVPKTVSKAAPNVEAQFRSFDIVASEGQFKPSEIIVNEGDTVHVDFTAQDSEYDITFPSYGMKQTASAGESKILEFQANQSGSFLYYCESCGGEESLATGNIVVVAKE
jgi:heme/copper-type cytochrome/quinol oxidase subunit 2